MFTVQLDQHHAIWRRLLDLYLPEGGSILDFTTARAST
jgi:hypothetical protein